MKVDERPIGVFDSGIGGLSVFKEVQKLLPYENLIYASDSLYAPYGIRSEAKIKERCVSIVDFMMDKKVKAIVVACNTATAVAIDMLRETYDVPFIAIEPAIKLAQAQSKNKRIGVIATKGTIDSQRFKDLVDTYKKDCEVFLQVGEGLVEQIEKIGTPSEDIQKNINQLLLPLMKQNIDSLVLGCTHYPLVMPLFKKAVGDAVHLVETGEAVAKQLKNILTERCLLNNNQHNSPSFLFQSSGKQANLQKVVDEYLGNG